MNINSKVWAYVGSLRLAEVVFAEALIATLTRGSTAPAPREVRRLRAHTGIEKDRAKEIAHKIKELLGEKS
jgi:hypothetical protein